MSIKDSRCSIATLFCSFTINEAKSFNKIDVLDWIWVVLIVCRFKNQQIMWVTQCIFIMYSCRLNCAAGGVKVDSECFGRQRAAWEG